MGDERSCRRALCASARLTTDCRNWWINPAIATSKWCRNGKASVYWFPVALYREEIPILKSPFGSAVANTRPWGAAPSRRRSRDSRLVDGDIPNWNHLATERPAPSSSSAYPRMFPQVRCHNGSHPEFLQLSSQRYGRGRRRRWAGKRFARRAPGQSATPVL